MALLPAPPAHSQQFERVEPRIEWKRNWVPNRSALQSWQSFKDWSRDFGPLGDQHLYFVVPPNVQPSWQPLTPGAARTYQDALQKNGGQFPVRPYGGMLEFDATAGFGSRWQGGYPWSPLRNWGHEMRVIYPR